VKGERERGSVVVAAERNMVAAEINTETKNGRGVVERRERRRKVQIF
jgi:hypothetical protein